MRYNLKFFGSCNSGGKGASAGTASLDALKKKADRLDSKAREYYQKIARDALTPSSDKYDSYTNAERNEIRKTWQRYGDDAREAERKYLEKREQGEKEQRKKTFVNSYGEATRREITTETYKRAEKRRRKKVLRNMGY